MPSPGWEGPLAEDGGRENARRSRFYADRLVLWAIPMTRALRAQSPFHCLKIFRKWTLKLHPLACERVRECERGGMKTQARTWLCASIEDIADNGMS